MQLRLDAADRLVELVEEERGPVRAEEAARRLFALRQAPVALARSLLTDVVETDTRLAWSGDAVTLAAPPGASLLLEDAVYVVVDLETTGLRPGSSGICEIGAVRLRGFEVEAEFETLVNPGMPIAAAASAVTGLRDEQLRGAPGPARAVRSFLAFAGDAVLVAHNARFDLAFLDRETERLTGSRIGAPVLDTVRLARTLLAGRVPGFGLAQLAWFLDTAERPCHRALPDARATGELLLALIGLAQERGARTVADLAELSATRARRLLDKRHLAFGAPTRPGVYRFVGRNRQVLYVGRARDLRSRLRSYFRSDRQRPAVEAALAAADSIEWQVTGSELEAALEELRLIRELRPPGNARVSRPERQVWLRARGDAVVASSRPSPVGPLRSRRTAQLAARVLRPDELARPETAVPRLRRRLRDLADARRFEDAGRLRDRLVALERVCRELKRLDRVRQLECCILVPAGEPGHVHAVFVARGRVAAERTLPPGGGAALEIEAGLAAARRAGELDLDELLLVDSFLRRPPPELRVAPLERGAILRARSLVPG
ncbi:MAG TPA: exonuclease domain-containing protein [Gaiellaceae bacterium]|jgi:DNA polymerase-3 subunit epsilon|nr:exonuclease domain-containing protein [Gaiellaceae bacterium]